MLLRQGTTQIDPVKITQPKFGRLDADLADVESAIERSAEYILSRQHPEGFWCGELEGDSMLEADYIFLHTLLESGDTGRLQRALCEMLRYQNDDGSWSLYPGGPGNISLSVKCYFSAKLMGIEADELEIAHQVILGDVVGQGRGGSLGDRTRGRISATAFGLGGLGRETRRGRQPRQDAAGHGRPVADVQRQGGGSPQGRPQAPGTHPHQ